MAENSNIQLDEKSIGNFALAGDVEGVKRCLSAGFDIDAPCDRGWTPLHLTVEARQLQVCELLLNMGADVDGCSESGGDPSPLSEACRTRDASALPFVELLIAHGANLEHRSGNGATPLEIACALENFECVRLLVDAGANPQKMAEIYLKRRGVSEAFAAQVSAYISSKQTQSELMGIFSCDAPSQAPSKSRFSL